MTDHPKARGHGVTQLGSMANIAARRTGSTAGLDLCHDLTSSEGAIMTFLREIMGESNSLTSSSSADPNPGQDPIQPDLEEAE